tara:strand:- start:8024 stop:8500 length:477 start_codon:yes stop_codon:yes gene_type:complete
MDDVTDIKKIGVSRITLGLIMSVAVVSGTVVWKASQIAGRIDDLEKQVQVIEGNTGTDSTVLAKLDEISQGVLENSDGLDDLRSARVDDLSRFTPAHITTAMAADVEAIREDVDEMKEVIASLAWVPSEFSTIWDRIYLAEEAIQSKTWGMDFYEENE